MENSQEINIKSFQFQAKLPEPYKSMVLAYLKKHPESTQADLLKLMIDNGALDMVDEIDINNNSTLVEIRAYWGKIVRLVAVLQGAKDEAEIIAASKVSEEMEDLKNRLKIVNEDSKKYKDENEKLKLQITQVEDYKSQIEALKKDKDDLAEQNLLLRRNIIDSATAKELQLENEKLRTEIEKLKGELKYQSGYADGLKDKNTSLKTTDAKSNDNKEKHLIKDVD